MQYVARLIADFVYNPCDKAEKNEKEIGGKMGMWDGSVVGLFGTTKQCSTELTSYICPLCLTTK